MKMLPPSTTAMNTMTLFAALTRENLLEHTMGSTRLREQTSANLRLLTLTQIFLHHFNAKHFAGVR